MTSKEFAQLPKEQRQAYFEASKKKAATRTTG